MRKKGMTILEILVAMSIFLMIATMAVGAFVSVLRTKSLVTNMRESQQKARTASEMVTRLSRQASKVEINDNGKTLKLTFNSVDAANVTHIYFAQFRIDNAALQYSETPIDSTVFASETNLLGNQLKLNSVDSLFSISGDTIPPKLSVLLKMNISDSNNYYDTDSIDIDTAVLLEGLR